MTRDRRKQIAWWASKVYEQSQMYADIVDPKRNRNEVSNKLDAIAGMARDLHFLLTEELPERMAG